MDPALTWAKFTHALGSIMLNICHLAKRQLTNCCGARLWVLSYLFFVGLDLRFNVHLPDDLAANVIKLFCP